MAHWHICGLCSPGAVTAAASSPVSPRRALARYIALAIVGVTFDDGWLSVLCVRVLFLSFFPPLVAHWSNWISDVSCLFPNLQLGSMSKPKKTITRAYGGSRCSSCVRNRWVTFWGVSPQCFFSSAVLRPVFSPLFLRISVCSIVRAFLIEEQKIVKRVLKSKVASA